MQTCQLNFVNYKLPGISMHIKELLRIPKDAILR